MILYGQPGRSFDLEFASNLSTPVAWTAFTRVPLLDTSRLVTGLPENPGSIFFRAHDLGVAGPVLEIRAGSGGALSLVLHGQPGSSYDLESASTLAAPVAWRNRIRVTLINSNLEFPAPAPAIDREYFRVKSTSP